MNLLQLASKPVIQVAPDVSVMDAARAMRDAKVRAVIVAQPQGPIQGIFTEHDNLVRITCQYRYPGATRISEVMTSPVIFGLAEMSAQEGLDLMIRGHCRHLPVLDWHQRPLGIVSLRNLLMRRIGEKQTDLEFLEAYMAAGGPG